MDSTFTSILLAFRSSKFAEFFSILVVLHFDLGSGSEYPPDFDPVLKPRCKPINIKQKFRKIGGIEKREELS